MKIHVEVWPAAASLHEQGYPTFSSSRLVEEVEWLFGDTGDIRLCRPGDTVHPTRAGGRLLPDQADVAEAYWPLRRKWTA